MEISNSYEDTKRADAYAKLEFPNTYYLAYRDLPEIIYKQVKGRKTLDFGCGTGRSTRFLKELGFDTIGVDISKHMIEKARESDPQGDYYFLEAGDLNQFPDNSFDFVLSVFTFDNIPHMDNKVNIFKQFLRILKSQGTILNLVSSPEIYKHEWASFSTKDFPENEQASCGDKVKIIVTDLDDRRPVEDILWPEEAYLEVYKKAGLELVQIHKPLGHEKEPFKWINETKIPPWVIYVIKK